MLGLYGYGLSVEIRCYIYANNVVERLIKNEKKIYGNVSK